MDEIKEHNCQDNSTRISQQFDGFEYIETYRCKFGTSQTVCNTVFEDIYTTELSNLYGCTYEDRTFHSFKDEIDERIVHKSEIEEDAKIPSNVILNRKNKKWVVFIRRCTKCYSTVRLTYKYNPSLIQM